MKEFLSILCLLICGILAFSFFSERTVASTDSTSMSLQTTTPLKLMCYGSNTVTSNISVTPPSTNASSFDYTTNYQVVISCSDNSLGSSPTYPASGDYAVNQANTTSSLCTQFGNNYVNVGYGVTWGVYSNGASGGSWPDEWSCDNCGRHTSEVCYIQCAPIVVTSPSTNCTWQ